MELAQILRKLWERRLAMVGVLVAAVVAAMVINLHVNPWPPRISEDSIQFASASTVMLIDSPQSPIADLGQTFDPLTVRADVYSRLMASPTVRAHIARAAGLPPEAIVTQGPFNPQAARALREPTAERRASDLAEQNRGYQLRFESEPGLPTVRISSIAPDVASAQTLANSAVKGFREFVAELEQRNSVPPAQRIRISQLGTAQGGVVNQGADPAALFLTFLGFLVVGTLIVLLGSSVVEGWRTLEREERRKAARAAVLGASGAPPFDIEQQANGSSNGAGQDSPRPVADQETDRG